MQKVGPTINVAMDEGMLVKLEIIARRHNISRAEALRRMVELGVDVYTDFDNVGIVHLAEVVARIRKWVRRCRQPQLPILDK